MVDMVTLTNIVADKQSWQLQHRKDYVGSMVIGEALTMR